ncbi:hypothetical protein BH11VER1_BH11VER1_28140 [soil metagenome]
MPSSRLFTRPQFWFGAVGLWFAVLFVLSSISLALPPGPQITHIDKVEHTLYFMAGSTCLHLGLRLFKPRWGFLFALGLTVLFCALVGAFDEFHQTFTPNRSGNDPGDWLADVVGGFIGSFIGTFLYSRLKLKAA